MNPTGSPSGSSFRIQTTVVTGVSGYTGKYIARRLLDGGGRVINLTGHPQRPLDLGLAYARAGSRVITRRYGFDDPASLAADLAGAEVLFNTYWVRFERDGVTFRQAIRNTSRLVEAARRAGLRRIIHVSISNPSLDSDLPYFRGKAEVESAVRESGLSYAILRPTVIFGLEDILINNIVFLLRKFPLFAVPGSGEYRLQPVYVDDVARLAVDLGDSQENVILDAAGPETYTFNELVKLLQEKSGSRAKIIHLPPGLALYLSRLVGSMVNDIVLTGDELHGLMRDLLVSGQPPTGHTRLSAWLDEHASQLGRRYSSELGRHFR
jgi:NADH dehydrogenase